MRENRLNKIWHVANMIEPILFTPARTWNAYFQVSINIANNDNQQTCVA